MPLINGAPIIHLMRGFRVCHIGGRFGSGKSLLAYRLAYELLKQHGYRYLLSNCRDAWSDRPEDIVLRPNDAGDPTYLDAVVVLDEAGVVFNSASEAKAIISFARKMNVIFIFPSFEEPPARVRFLQVQRMYNLQVVGLPLWWYGARLNTRMARDKYAFGLWRPSEMYGIYDTGDFPADAAGIDAFSEGLCHTKNRRKRPLLH